MEARAVAGYRNIDLGIFRQFRTQEKITLRVRAELSSAFNMISLRIPNALATTANVNQAVMSSARFGQIRNPERSGHETGTVGAKTDVLRSAVR